MEDLPKILTEGDAENDVETRWSMLTRIFVERIKAAGSR
jgi:hypothetical protein